MAISQLRLQAKGSMNSPSPYPAWKDAAFDDRRSYLYCLKDRAIPYIAQKTMVATSAVKWNLGTLDCGHSPFLSHPTELSLWVAEQIRLFAALK